MPIILEIGKMYRWSEEKLVEAQKFIDATRVRYGSSGVSQSYPKPCNWIFPSSALALDDEKLQYHLQRGSIQPERLEASETIIVLEAYRSNFSGTRLSGKNSLRIKVLTGQGTLGWLYVNQLDWKQVSE